MKQPIYQLLAYLLQYPNKQMEEALPEITVEIEALDDNLLKECLQEFINTSAAMPLEDWVDHYIDHFDFGNSSNLYVTYLKLGEQRERGLELLKLKKYYEAYGFSLSDKELPDYLPLMLEFCANVPVEVSNELLSMHYKAISEIRGKIQKTNSYYHLLFDALFLQMSNEGLALLVAEEL